MISLRSLTRSVPRAAAQITRSAIRRPAQPCAVLRSSWMPARPQLAAAFSTSHLRPAKSGEVDDELVAKFESEIQAELEMRDAEEVPTSIKEFLDNGPWEIQDTPGQEEVILTRAYGAETVRVSFSIADLNNLDPEADFEDRALADEEDMDDNINQGSKDFKVAPEDSIAAADGEEGELEEQPESFPVRVNVTIEKAGKGALSVESMAQDGQIVIDNVYYFTDAELAYSKSAEKAHAAQEQYVGPPFGNLDEDLQVLLERYLDERGINTALALFVPDYIDMKEQKEYVTWLLNVKSFVES